eukprot:3369569-Rhodomonas_salina.1
MTVPDIEQSPTAVPEHNPMTVPDIAWQTPMPVPANSHISTGHRTERGFATRKTLASSTPLRCRMPFAVCINASAPLTRRRYVKYVERDRG